MGKFIDLTGKTFGKWTVLKRLPNRKKCRYWLCRCECGVKKSVSGSSLAKGTSTSCGCHRKKYLSDLNKSHGDYGTKLYRCWASMKRRCDNKNCSAFKHYGERGITYLTEWSDYENFKQWALQSGYQDNLTIDRIDNDGDYEPDNCRWISMELQSQNRRSTVLNPEKVRYLRNTWEMIKYQMSQKDFAEREGISPSVLNNCLLRKTWKSIL